MFDKLETAARSIEKKCFLVPFHETELYIHNHHPKGLLDFNRVLPVPLIEKERKTGIIELITRLFN